MGYPIKKQNMIEQLYLQNNQQQPQTLHNTPGLQNSMRLAGQNIMQNQSQFSQQKLGQSQSQPDLQRNLNNNSYPQKFPFFVPPEEEPQKFERYGFRVQDIYAPYSPKRFMPSHVEQSLNQEIDELSAHLREIKPHVIKAPPSYLLNDTMTGFRDLRLESMIDLKTKHLLLQLALQEYELMSYLAKQKDHSTTENRIKITRLQELARQRLEMERIIIREDPKVFMKNLQIQKQKDEVAKYGKQIGPQALPIQESTSLISLNHPQTYFEAKPYSLYEEKLQAQQKNKQHEMEQFKNRIKQKINPYNATQKPSNNIKPKLVSISSRNLYQVGDQVIAMIEESHSHVKIEGNSDINIVFEYQIKGDQDEEQQQSGMNNTKNTFKSEIKQMSSVVYGWTCLDLFELQTFQLKRGMYKIPLYQPPTDLNMKNLSNQDRIKDLYLCLRVTHAKNDTLQSHKCTPSAKHLYLIPEIHADAPTKLIQNNGNSEGFKDSKIVNYKSLEKPIDPKVNKKVKVKEGIKIYVNHIQGNATMLNKRYRVACLLQSLKEIQRQKNTGKLCFMVTEERPFFDKRSQTDPVVAFNQEKVWPFQVSTIRQGLYLVVQLLERREEYQDMQDQPNQELSRDFLDKVYRVVGYGVVKLNDEGNRASLKYGSYELDLARPPVYIEEYEDPETEKMPIQIKVTFVRATAGVDPSYEPREIHRNNMENTYNPDFHREKQYRQQQTSLVDEGNSGGGYGPTMQSETFMKNFMKSFNHKTEGMNSPSLL
eukprot:403340250